MASKQPGICSQVLAKLGKRFFVCKDTLVFWLKSNSIIEINKIRCVTAANDTGTTPARVFVYGVCACM